MASLQTASIWESDFTVDRIHSRTQSATPPGVLSKLLAWQVNAQYVET